MRIRPSNINIFQNISKYFKILQNIYWFYPGGTSVPVFVRLLNSGEGWGRGGYTSTFVFPFKILCPGEKKCDSPFVSHKSVCRIYRYSVKMNK